MNVPIAFISAFAFYLYLVNECNQEPEIPHGSLSFTSKSKKDNREYDLSCNEGYQEIHPSGDKHEMVCSDTMQWQYAPSCQRMYNTY